jgi:hypothetical protein
MQRNFYCIPWVVLTITHLLRIQVHFEFRLTYLKMKSSIVWFEGKYTHIDNEYRIEHEPFIVTGYT